MFLINGPPVKALYVLKNLFLFIVCGHVPWCSWHVEDTGQFWGVDLLMTELRLSGLAAALYHRLAAGPVKGLASILWLLQV